jgi:hypothetical protein
VIITSFAGLLTEHQPAQYDVCKLLEKHCLFICARFLRGHYDWAVVGGPHQWRGRPVERVEQHIHARRYGLWNTLNNKFMLVRMQCPAAEHSHVCCSERLSDEMWLKLSSERFQPTLEWPAVTRAAMELIYPGTIITTASFPFISQEHTRQRNLKSAYSTESRYHSSAMPCLTIVIVCPAQ